MNNRAAQARAERRRRGCDRLLFVGGLDPTSDQMTGHDDDAPPCKLPDPTLPGPGPQARRACAHMGTVISSRFGCSVVIA
ncbi:hypothetical protein B0T18DRAFT_397852 [Schizothecium vesticola]|uniref:Uncharacterized protein n=1 Tax=Schizothecium vesticola TaxID=314040 RepID=A0AA40FA16_9PEZI|nr:hypothetical protein B0T18DRAFT_397852 [Schizothecium vesticola]